MIRRSAALPSVVLLAAVALSGCSGSDDPADPDDAASSEGGAAGPGATDSPTEGAPTISPDLPALPTITRAEGAAGDLVWDPATCGTDGGKQTVRGKIENSSRKSADYSVNISWISDGADTLGRGIAVVQDVEPGATKPFTLTATVLDGATQCVPNVLRGVIRGQG